MSFEGTFVPQEGRERRISRDEIVRDLEILLEVDQSFNLTGHSVEVFKHPTVDTYVVVQLKNNDAEPEEDNSVYKGLLTRIELGNGTFATERMEVSEWEGHPCLIVMLPN